MPLLESQLEDEMIGLLERVPTPVTHLDKTALEWEPLLALVAGYAISRVGREGIHG